MLYRDEHGHTQAKRAADVSGINEFVDSGASMGELWMEGHLGVGDPLVNAGSPQKMNRETKKKGRRR